MTGKSVLAVITARGGSKGIPGKNLRLLAGKPLIVHTIECALALGDRLSGIVVSTDDADIARISVEAGADVPFLRPAELSRDETPSLPVLQHAVEAVEQREKKRFDWVLLLQPTSPLRRPADIAALLDAVDDGTATAAIAVTDASDSHPTKLYSVNGGALRRWSELAPEGQRRQDLPAVYKVNGAGYLTRRDVLMDGNTLFGSDPRPVIMPKERSIDIDAEVDLLIAETLLRYHG